MTNRKNWFTELNTKADMNSFAIGVIGEIMSDPSTTAVSKVIDIALTLRGMNLAWDIKKTPAKGAEEENDHFNCSINLEKVESFCEGCKCKEK